MPRRVQKLGFTLIELLVVISIVAILVALLLPALNQSKGNVWLMECLSRSKSMAVLTTAYTMDSGGWWPTPYGQASVASYRTVIQDYARVVKTNSPKDWGMRNPMICPANYSLNAPHTLFWGDGGWPMYDGQQQGTGNLVASYALNPYFYEGGYGGVPANQPRKGVPKNPAKTLLYVDAWRESRVHYWYVSAGRSFMRFRHFESTRGACDGKLNMTYCDGSVRTWQYEVGNEIYPLSGNGLYTTQRGFVWSPLP